MSIEIKRKIKGKFVDWLREGGARFATWSQGKNVICQSPQGKENVKLTEKISKLVYLRKKKLRNFIVNCGNQLTRCNSKICLSLQNMIIHHAESIKKCQSIVEEFFNLVIRS